MAKQLWGPPGLMVALALMPLAAANFASFTTTVEERRDCLDCSIGAAAFNPPCSGPDATLSQTAQRPWTPSDPCSLRCWFNCTRRVGVPGSCTSGWTGDACDVNLDACVTTPCDDNAVCTDFPPPATGSASGRRCACLVGYSGDGETCTPDDSRIITLRQDDFNNGTYRIQRPGVYQLGEDIVFNPNPRSAGGNSQPREDQFTDRGGPYPRRAYQLGFFAAIAIECAHVELNLNGYEIGQSVEHALMQRFFAVIELANAPFPYAQGPHNFTNVSWLSSASDVRIHSGHIGRTTHHSIHGNNVSHITIANLTMEDFEVAGVSINGGQHITVRDCVIGPSRADVPVTGLFSTGLFIKPYVEQIVAACPSANIELDRVSYSGQAILDALNGVIDDAYNSVVCGQGAVPSVVNNRISPRDGRPDGSAIYGIVLHNTGTHTNGYAMERNNSVCLDIDGEIVGMMDEYDLGVGRQRCRTFVPAGNTDITVQNVRIQGLEVNVAEVAALSTTNWNKNRATLIRTAQVDVVGAVYQYEVNVDADFGSTGRFKGNPVSNAQLFVAKNLACLPDPGNRGVPCQRQNPAVSPGTPCMRNLGGTEDRRQTFPNTIRQSTLDWAASGGMYPAGDNFVICGGDNMFHVNKGAIGFRVDAGDRVVMRNVEIDTVRNLARPPSSLCPASSTVRLHPLQSQAWYTGSDAVGISFAATVNVDLVGRNVVRNIVSSSGNAYGMQVLQVSDFIRGRVVIGSLQTLRGQQTYPGVSSQSIYSGRPAVKEYGGVPETQSVHIDSYACIPGDNMEMYSPVDSMDMMMDDGGDPDPHTMTCRIVADLETYIVPPFVGIPNGPTNYRATCAGGPINTETSSDSSGKRGSDGVARNLLPVLAVIVVVLVIAVLIRWSNAKKAHVRLQAMARRHERAKVDDASSQQQVNEAVDTTINRESDGEYMDVEAAAENHYDTATTENKAADIVSYDVADNVTTPDKVVYDVAAGTFDEPDDADSGKPVYAVIGPKGTDDDLGTDA